MTTQSTTTGYDAATRKKLWEARDSLIGKLAKYKSFPIGVKEAPRLPWYSRRR